MGLWDMGRGLGLGCGCGLALSEVHPGRARLPAPPLSHHLGSCVSGFTALASLGSPAHTGTSGLSVPPPAEKKESGHGPTFMIFYKRQYTELVTMHND